MSYVKDTDILDKSDGGLEIILSYYPAAGKVIHGNAKSFKIRESEKTASASLKKLAGGVWVVTDFGGDQVSRNAIQICMLEENLNYHQACELLGARYHIEGAKMEVFLPVIKKRPLKLSEKPGEYYFEFEKDFTKEQLQLLGSRVNAVHCGQYKLKNCKSFIYCKENEVIETTATEHYPIFVFDFEDWQKIYQPNSYEKKFRFRYAGKKPKRHVWGIDVIKKEFDKRKKKQEENDYDFSIIDETDDDNNSKKKKKYDPRLDRVFIASGGSDALNLRSFEEYPIWFNSESEHLNFEEYKLLKTYAKEIIYLADLDSTGVKQALYTGLKFLDIKLLWLPNKLKEYKDKRGNPCKDFKDYVRVFNDEKTLAFINGFKKLIANALPLQFWTEFVNNAGKVTYNVSNTRLYHFLSMLGFGRYETEANKEGFLFIKKDGSIIRILQPYQIENFVHEFLELRGMSPDLRDYVYRSPQLSERSLSKLPKLNIDFTDADRSTQYQFFSKKIWKITGDEILEYKQGEVDKFVWEDKIIDFEVKKLDPLFEIKMDELNQLDIKVLNEDCWFMNYLINASRMHWKEELEDFFEGKPEADALKYSELHKFNIQGPNLSEDKQYEQKLHLINKLYSIGYLLHKYKNYGKPWAVFAMDNKVSDLGESHGGSGKSICYGPGLKPILKRRVYLKGRDQKLTQNDFIYHEVSEDTDYILVDDATQYLNFDFFFSEITGSLKVNPKNGSPFEIPFEKSPKFVFTSNFALRNVDPSTARRLLLTVFSDYYHGTSDEEYKQVRKVSDDFDGKNLFTDFDWNQWNLYYNFCAQCVQLFLQIDEKLNPPMDNVTKRTLQAEMGEAFMGWADGFFSQSENEVFKHLNVDFAKETAFDDFLKATKQHKWTPNKFKKACVAYCKWNEWVFNPKHMHNNGSRIIKTIEGKSQEVFFFDTTNRKMLDNVEKILTDSEDDGLTIFDR